MVALVFGTRRKDQPRKSSGWKSDPESFRGQKPAKNGFRAILIASRLREAALIFENLIGKDLTKDGHGSTRIQPVPV